MVVLGPPWPASIVAARDRSPSRCADSLLRQGSGWAESSTACCRRGRDLPRAWPAPATKRSARCPRGGPDGGDGAVHDLTGAPALDAGRAHRVERRTGRSRAVLGHKRCLGREVAERRRGRSEEHTSEHQSLMRTSYAVLCLKKKNCVKQY